MNKEDICDVYKKEFKDYVAKVDIYSCVYILLQRYLPKDKNAYILDAACGDGRYCKVLREMGYKNIYAVDLFDNIAVQGISYLKGSMDALPEEWNGMFDFILCQSAIYYLDNPSDGIREFERCLKTDGKILFTAHTKYSLWTYWRKLKLLLGLSSVNHLRNVRFDRDVKEYLLILNEFGFELLWLDGIQLFMLYTYYERLVHKLRRDYSIILPTISNHIVFPEYIRRLRARYAWHSLIVARKKT